SARSLSDCSWSRPGGLTFSTLARSRPALIPSAYLVKNASRSLSNAHTSVTASPASARLARVSRIGLGFTSLILNVVVRFDLLVRTITVHSVSFDRATPIGATRKQYEPPSP